MAAGYRSFLSVDAGEPLIEAVIAHIGRWSAGKHIDTPPGAPGRYARGPNDLITVMSEPTRDGRIYRWRRHHPFAHGAHEMLRTTVTALERTTGPGWLWTEIELPTDCALDPSGSSSFMSPPGFVRSLISELSCRDGRTPVSVEPQWIAFNHLPDLMDYLADETRRGPVYVASQGGRRTREFETWASQVLREVIGLGAAFLIGGMVETEFNEMVGPRHAVGTGTIRTYLPEVNLDDPDDPVRHRMLGRERVEQSTARQLSHVLGLALHDRSEHVPIPAEAVAVNRILVEREKELTNQPRPSTLHKMTLSEDGAQSGAGSTVEASILAALQNLENEIKALRDTLAGRAPNGHRHLNAL